MADAAGGGTPGMTNGIGGTMKEKTEIAPVPTAERRDLGPLETGMVAVVVSAITGLMLGLLLERGWDELWKWTLVGALVPIIVVFSATMARLLIWTVNASTWRAERRLGIDINGDGTLGQPDTIRLLPVRTQSPRIRLSGESDGYPVEDLQRLIEIAYRKGHAVRDFLGATLPSGRKITDYDRDLRPFYEILTRAGLLVERTERSKGRLMGTEQEALRLFGLR